jgi:hypothetical protein
MLSSVGSFASHPELVYLLSLAWDSAELALHVASSVFYDDAHCDSLDTNLTHKSHRLLYMWKWSTLRSQLS